ncbi:MAG: PAS domain-containing protein [Candidatus Cloacimonetes bacterium]|nr:PAS domain-containing protein [Candidatus Cloacimonadota bacterium]
MPFFNGANAKEELGLNQSPNANPKRSRVIDTEYIKTDGSVIDISMHMSFIWGPEGEYQGLLGVTRDVSEERRIERELKESNSYIRSLLAAIPDLMFILDKDGVVLDLKAGTDRNLLVPREHGIGRALNEILPHEISDQTLVAISEILAGRDVDNIHYQLTIENERHDFEARLSSYEGNKVIVMVRDISKEQRAISALESQSRFQAILADISTDFLKSKLDNLSGLIDQGLQKVGEHFQVHRAYLFRYSEDMQELIPLAMNGALKAQSH